MALTQITSNGIKDDEVKNSDMADDSVGIAELSATGTASNTTYLRGDNTWSTPPDNDTTYTHPNHTGEVTSAGDGATTITDDVVDEANLKISNAGSNGQFLQKQSGNTGGLTWATPDQAGGGTGTDYEDNVKIRFGDDHDLEIFHDGSDSYVKDVGTGNLYVVSVDGNVNLQVNGSENAVKCIENGAVEIYYDAAEKLATTSTGILVTGNAKVGDVGKLIAGDGDDLQIYHDGNNSVIKEAGTGDLRIQTASFRLRNEDASEMMISADANGAVYLAYNGTTRLQTYADGVEIQGDFWLNNQTNSGYDIIFDESANLMRWKDDVKATFGDGDDLEIYHSGTHSFIKDAGTGNLQIWTNQLSLLDSGGTESMIQAIENGAVELYHNGVKKFHTNAGGCQVFGNLTNGDSTHHFFGDSNDLDIYHDASDSWIQEDGGGNLHIASTGAGIMFFKGSSGSTEAMCRMYTDGAVELYHDNVKQFYTTSDGSRFVGQAEFDGGIRLTDTREIQFGDPAGGDFKIYHDGSHSYIDESGTGNLKIKSSRVDILNPAGDEDMIVAVENGEVELFYDGSKKLATHSGGVSIHGHCSLTSADDYELRLGAGSDFKLYHDGTHSWMTNATGTLVIEADTLDIRAVNNEHYIEASLNGAVKLYDNNVQVFETHSAGIKVGEVGSTAEIWFPDSNNADEGLIRYRHDEDWMSFFTWGSERFRIEDNGDLYGQDTSISPISSDSRLKKNVADYNYDLAKFKQLRPRTFEWINTSNHEHPTGTRQGFIAQEVETVDTSLTMEVLVDEANTADRALLDADGKNKSTKLGSNDALYVSVIQQLITKIETLETKVATLESA